MKTDCILLFGPRACGKTTVGKALAGLLDQWTFVDIDYEYRLRFDAGNTAIGTPSSGEGYYRGCRQILLAELERERVVIALGGGALVNHVAPDIGIRNLRDCQKRGGLVLVLPSRLSRRSKRIIYSREAKRNYVVPREHVYRHFDERIRYMKRYAELAVYGAEPNDLARRIIRWFRLTPY